jgi:hypothetical protein
MRAFQGKGSVLAPALRGLRDPGLWDDEERVIPNERIPKEVEQAIVCSFWLPWDASLTRNVNNLARRHGVSRGAVKRIWKRYGIRVQRRWRLDQGVAANARESTQFAASSQTGTDFAQMLSFRGSAKAGTVSWS